MDASTPVTQSFPGGDQPQDKPVESNPTPNLPVENKIRPPSRPKGPNAAAVVLGVVALALAALIIVSETTTWRVDWSGLGPGAIVVIGVVFVVLGVVGLVRRRDDV